MRLVAAIVFAIAVSTASGATLPFGIIFDDGKLGVNFFGFNAAVGIGGRSNNGEAGGGLHVEAGTPFGQRAVAGLGGSVDGGRSGGGLYAGATAGGNIAASAGLNGDISGDSARGSLYSRASAGPLQVEKSLDRHTANKDEQIVEHEYVVEHEHAVEHEHVVDTVPKIQKTKTKTKTKIVKEVESDSNDVYAPSVHKEVNIDTRHSADEVEVVKVIPVVYKKHYHHRRRRINAAVNDASQGIGYGTAYLNAFLSPSYKAPVARYEVEVEKEVVPTHRPSQVQVQKQVVYTAKHRPGFFEDIFNIPISTLGAVSKFLSNSASGAHGGAAIDVRKTVSIS